MKEIIINFILTLAIVVGISTITYYCAVRADRICSEYSKGNNTKYRECLGL